MLQTQIRFAIPEQSRACTLDRCRLIFHAFVQVLFNKFNETNARLFQGGHFLVLYQVRLAYRTSLSTQNSSVQKHGLLCYAS